MEKFCFSHECSVVIGKDSRVYCWRRDDEKDARYLVCPPKQRQISIMVWGAISYNGHRTLKWVKGNIDSKKCCTTLQEKLLPLLQSVYPDNDYTFIQDNASVHSSLDTRTWLDSKSVNISIWPAQSPDLNIIENIWRDCKVNLRKNLENCKSPSILYERFEEIFYGISTDVIQKLYSSIPRRLKAVTKSKGTLTKY